MIIKDEKGQLSVEMIFLVAISIIVLLVFTLPIAQMAISNNLDVMDTLSAKSAMYQIANAIDEVYSQGQGAKITESINIDKELSVDIKNNKLTTEVQLHDNKVKKIECEHKADNLKTHLHFKKGLNKILVQWAEGSREIKISQI